MKKISIILVMLFWCNVSFAEIIKNRCFGYQGYGTFSTHRDSFEWVETIDTEKQTYKWKVKGKNWNTQREFFHFGDDNLSFRNPEGVDLNINFITFITTYIGHQGYIQNDCVRETIAKKPEKKKVELASMIDDAKKTCKELGFTEGTEKFSDCSLKLYSQSVELAAKNNQTVVMQPQSSGSSSMTIYDPVRDSRALMRQGQRMLSGACTFGINC